MTDPTMLLNQIVKENNRQLEVLHAASQIEIKAVQERMMPPMPESDRQRELTDYMLYDYWQLRKWYLAETGSDEEASKLLDGMLATVTLTHPDLDRVVAQPWPGDLPKVQRKSHINLKKLAPANWSRGLQFTAYMIGVMGIVPAIAAACTVSPFIWILVPLLIALIVGTLIRNPK